MEGPIRKLLAEHVQNPYKLLREANLQARLRELILIEFENQGIATSSDVHVVPDPHNDHFQFPVLLPTCRVQLEVKLRHHDQSGECTDVVVLRKASSKDPIELTCKRGGPLDIIARIRPRDVDYAIELKASPSNNHGQRRLFRSDVEKLYDLATSYPTIKSYFVLVDKSLSIEGIAQVNPPLHVDNWIIGLRHEPPEKPPFVTIVDLNPVNLNPRLRYYHP